MHDLSVTAGLLRKDRWVVVAGMAAITALAWAYMLSLAAGMQPGAMDTMVAAQVDPWRPADVWMTFTMWAIMMVAMMLPSAAPLILLFSTLQSKRSTPASPLPDTGLFATGYIAVWTLFSAAATLLQWALHTTALLSPMLVSTSPLLGGALLIAAGIYQWTRLKQACLTHCRSPLEFLSRHWRSGHDGAFIMGMHHGWYCVGCCSMLMLLLFVLGVMNLLWVATLALIVLIEKVAPAGRWLARCGGLVLVAWGVESILTTW